MNTLLNLLALAGGAAAAWHLVRAALRFLNGGAREVWADELARTYARHGDLTSMDETRKKKVRTARGTRRALAAAVGWLAVLAVPPLTAWPRLIYAAYSVLWVPPLARRVRTGRTGRGGGR